MKNYLFIISLCSFFLFPSSASAGRGDPLPSPTLLTPADHASFEEFASVTFTWSAVSGANYYSILLCYDAALTQIQHIYSTSDTSYTVQISGASHLYWSVQASNSSSYSAYPVAFEIVLQTNGPVDCVVSDWGSWVFYSELPCDSGFKLVTQERIRIILTEPANGGAACPALTEFREVSEPCGDPVDCVVSEWGSWSTVSLSTCVNSSQYVNQERYRTVVTPAAFGGAICPSLTDYQVITQYCYICPDLPSEILNYDNPPVLINSASTCLADIFSQYDVFETADYGICSAFLDASGAFLPSITEQQKIDCQNAVTSATNTLCVPGYTDHDGARDGRKYFLGCVWYGSLPYSSYMVRVWGYDLCSDDVRLHRVNDVPVAGVIDQELYNFQSTYRGVTSDLPYASVYRYEDDFTFHYKGDIFGPFKRSDIINNYGAGEFQFALNVPNTLCGASGGHFIGKPEFTSVCLSDKSFSYSMSGAAGVVPSYPAESFKFYRYPVNENFQAVGPLELIKEGVADPAGGSINSSEVTMEKGYKYRFREDRQGFIWQYDFIKWPCSSVESQGAGAVRSGAGRDAKGAGSSAIGGGVAYEVKK